MDDLGTAKMSDGSHEEQQASDGDAWASATGRELRDRREARGGDLVEIAETLCIRREFLDAIERGDHGALPGTAYAVGFVRTYARHLGLDGAHGPERCGLCRAVRGPRPLRGMSVAPFAPLGITLSDSYSEDRNS